MTDSALIEQTVRHVQAELADAEAGHDWWHTRRVWQLARRIAVEEKADIVIVELAALLHDIADSKFHGGDEEIGPARARTFLEQNGVAESRIAMITAIIRHLSFKGGRKSGFDSPEFRVVQDADRLDAIGAIGIARAFHYGGYRNRPIHDPGIPLATGMTPEAYMKNQAPTIHHFYDKLLLLEGRLHTATAKRLARGRHRFLLDFLRQFYLEWNEAHPEDTVDPFPGTDGFR